MSVRISNDTLREPDEMVHCGPYDGDGIFVRNPVAIVEMVSPSTARIEAGHKLIDYLTVPSILPYLIVYGDEARVIHHRRDRADGAIATSIPKRGDAVGLFPPGFPVAVEAMFER